MKKDKLVEKCKVCEAINGQMVDISLFNLLGEKYCPTCLSKFFILNWFEISDSLTKTQEMFWKDFTKESVETINLIANQGKKILVLMAEVANKDREIAELKGKLKEKK